MERIRPLIAAVLIACGFVAAASQAMVFPGKDWQEVPPEAQGVDSAKIKEAVSYLENNSGSDGVKELVIIRNGNKHMLISARELARFGHLFLNRGKWKNKQLISAAWIDAAAKAHVPASMPLEELSGADGRGTYGYNWWANGVKADGKRKWPDAPVGTYTASGYNNNDMFVIGKWNMVIVRLGLDQRDFPMTDTVYDMFLKKVGEAIEQ